MCSRMTSMAVVEAGYRKSIGTPVLYQFKSYFLLSDCSRRESGKDAGNTRYDDRTRTYSLLKASDPIVHSRHANRSHDAMAGLSNNPSSLSKGLPTRRIIPRNQSHQGWTRHWHCPRDWEEWSMASPRNAPQPTRLALSTRAPPWGRCGWWDIADGGRWDSGFLDLMVARKMRKKTLAGKV
jgi:hypothetical protein